MFFWKGEFRVRIRIRVRIEIVSLDLSSFDTGNVTDIYNMFSESRVLRTIKASSDFVTNKVRYSFVFYKNDSLVGGNGTTYNDSNPKDKTYARIDIPGRPGYFTQGP